jgi:hypothetical protein
MKKGRKPLKIIMPAPNEECKRCGRLIDKKNLDYRPSFMWVACHKLKPVCKDRKECMRHTRKK